MPMLSFSHRTTAPAMATEPWEEGKKKTTSDLDHITFTPRRTVLQCGGELRNKM